MFVTVRTFVLHGIQTRALPESEGHVGLVGVDDLLPVRAHFHVPLEFVDEIKLLAAACTGVYVVEGAGGFDPGVFLRVIDDRSGPRPLPPLPLQHCGILKVQYHSFWNPSMFLTDFLLH